MRTYLDILNLDDIFRLLKNPYRRRFVSLKNNGFTFVLKIIF